MSAYEIYSSEADEVAFATVYRAHSQKLLRYCQYRLRDRYEAEDVVQEAFARAWRTMPAGRDGNFYPWLRVVAGNLCTDVLRKRARSEPVAAPEVGAVDGEMEHITDEADRILVRQALGRLNDRHRSALMMRESEGLTYDQIAQRTGTTAGTVESLLWRARQALRREFTVLAGREGSLAVFPFLSLLTGRGRAAGRQAWLRVTRRFPALDPSESPVPHVAVAAFAALTVASGVALTIGTGGNHPPAPALIVQDSSTTITAPSGSLRVTPTAAGAPAPSPPGPAPATTSNAPTATATPPSTVTSGPAVHTGPAPLRVVDPVVVGPKAATYADQAPVTVKAAGVTVGVSPPVATGYLGSVTQRVAGPIASGAGIPQEKKP